MALYPKAVHKLLPENKTQGHITPTQAILHSAVDAEGPTSLFPFFARADVKEESHFFVKLDGAVEQYMDTTVRADANRFANVRAVSIETEDDGDPNQRRWTTAQLSSIQALLEWLFAVHPIQRRVCPSWDQSGVGYHSMWGAPSQWTPYKGKTCPGEVRKVQFWDTIMPWLVSPVDDEDDEMVIVMHAPDKAPRALVGSRLVGFKSSADYDNFRKGLQAGGVPIADWNCTVAQYDETSATFRNA